VDPHARHYVALRLAVEADNADAWADALLASGAFAIDAADPGAGTGAETPIYAEPGEAADARWPITQLTALFDSSNDPYLALERAAATLMSVPPQHETFAVPEQDWVRATQSQFDPIHIADGFWVVPSWCQPPEPAALNLSLDPGLAFGTGSHPTTRLCLLWLRAQLTPRAGETISVLDYGCGSGVLSIAAKKLGATRVVGTDVDAQALTASIANARANDVDASFVAPETLGEATFDIVVANILTNALLILAPSLAARVDDGGRVALCGILASQTDAVIIGYRRWFEIEVWESIEGWALLAGTRFARRGENFG
jgi:ribosomal protein L11 methyltransferase